MVIDHEPADIEVFVRNRRFAAGHPLNDRSTGNRRGRFVGLTGLGASGLRRQERLGMPPHLTPVVDYTKTRTAQQDHKGQPAANQAVENRWFH